MSDSNLHLFVDKIMDITADYSGMAGASAGIIGSTSTNSDIVYNLRKDTFSLARNLDKNSSKSDKVNDLAKKIEGALLSLKLTNAISEPKLNELTGKLHSLLK